MHSRLWLPLTLLVSASLAPTALSQESRTGYSLQVASFPSSPEAKQYAARLASLGEQPHLVTVSLPMRGDWTRVIIGGFESVRAARERGLGLVAKRAIDGFLVISEKVGAGIHKAISHPDSVLDATLLKHNKLSLVDARPTPLRSPAFTPLPSVPTRSLMLSPSLVDCSRAPRPDPVQVAIGFIVGAYKAPVKQAGLWLSGDIEEALTRLRWIAGAQVRELLRLSDSGRVELDWDEMLRQAGIYDTSRPDAAMTLAEYIASNEGLLLIVQLTEGMHRYCLHIGQSAPTRAGLIQVKGGINLDRNYDSRINPHRRNRKKLDCELPPPGFDALIALNPDAKWLNLSTKEIVPSGHITFHELAEAHAKVELGLDYLSSGTNPGAHDLAIERERRLKSERPASTVVLTAGSNLILTLADEEQRYSNASTSAANRRR